MGGLFLFQNDDTGLILTLAVRILPASSTPSMRYGARSTDILPTNRLRRKARATLWFFDFRNIANSIGAA